MNAMQRALRTAAFGALLCSTAFGQLGGGAAADAGQGEEVKRPAKAEKAAKKLLVKYTEHGGILAITRELTIDVAGNAKYVEKGVPVPTSGSARLESEEVAGLTRAVTEFFRVPPHLGRPILPDRPDRKLVIEDDEGQVVTRSANGTDAMTGALVDWLEEIAALAKKCVLADSKKLFEAKLARPERGGLSASGMIVTRDEKSAIYFKIDPKGRRTMTAPRRLSLDEVRAVHAMIALADPAPAEVTAAATAHPPYPRRDRRLVLRFWDPIDVTALREVDASDTSGSILPGDDILVHLLAKS